MSYYEVVVLVKCGKFRACSSRSKAVCDGDLAKNVP